MRAVFEGQHLYNGACPASVAAAAAAQTTPTAAVRWRAQSLEWLGAYLARSRERLVAFDREIADAGDPVAAEGLRTKRTRLLSDLEQARTKDSDLDAIRASPEFARLFEGIPRPE